MGTLNDLLTGVGNEFLQVDFGRIGVHLLLMMLLSQVLAWHYLRFAQVLSNKQKFARNFVPIATTTLLVITIVGSSLALSLGLVGALSIVRFRTPIKEPEELAYLFLAIGCGIGLGAGEVAVTLTVFAALLAYMTVRHYSGRSQRQLRTVLQISAPIDDEMADRTELGLLMPAVEKTCNKVDLRRVDYQGKEFNASLLVEVGSTDAISKLIATVQETLPGAEISLVERDSLD